MRAWLVGVTLAVVTGIVVVVVWGVAQNKQADWWSAWGQWVGGGGSIVAAAVAVGIALEGWRRADQERRDNESIQARLVFARYDVDSRYLVVVNGSGGAVSMVKLTEMTGNNAVGRWERSETDPVQFGEVIVEVIPPHESVKLPMYYRFHPGQIGANPGATPTITFLDSDGRLWRRVGRDDPQRQTAHTSST
ncbi:hypothetical protein [Amycolatopsis thermoflava]|uniref:hypothetical protein n=1 Tax=Amycolatopsis thermoflava TaxID=84480 RepID=UPI003F4A7B95